MKMQENPVTIANTASPGISVPDLPNKGTKNLYKICR